MASALDQELHRLTNKIVMAYSQHHGTRLDDFNALYQTTYQSLAACLAPTPQPAPRRGPGRPRRSPPPPPAWSRQDRNRGGRLDGSRR